MPNNVSSHVISVGEEVWINPLKVGEFHIPWSGKILKIYNSSVRVLDVDGHEVIINYNDIIKTVHTSDIVCFNDMIHLSDLQEQSILRNIHIRFKKNIIYTSIGDILVAMNPFKNLKIYSDSFLMEYHSQNHQDSPHIYAIGARALSNLQNFKTKNQNIVISGETGSGKTESTKFLLNFFAFTSSKTSIGKQILMANPIFEAFGNAKTTKNDNSSRFGKYIEILFKPDGTMRCASIQHYLLEKSRIKSQNPGDRNYHIFYIMLIGLPQATKDILQLSQPKDYYYLRQGGFLNCDGKDEKADFLVLKDAFRVLDFTDAEVLSIYSIVAAILHIGNISFKSVVKNHYAATLVEKKAHFKSVISQLSLNEKHFIEALTRKTICVEGHKLLSEVSSEQAVRNRDAFSMSLYTHLFEFVLTKINNTVCDDADVECHSIGILDIFGFENFSSNSFEQLCINYANEKLQQFFLQYVFKEEEQIYLSEGLQWEPLTYVDNANVIELLGKKISLLSLIDEQTLFPKGTDLSFLLHCDQIFSGNNIYIKAKSEKEMTFGIKHYAGAVTYSVEGFIEKNMNSLSVEWLEVIRGSQNNFLRSLFEKELNSFGKRQVQTLSSQYRQSLETLMIKLTAGSPLFIRCLKPNAVRKPNEFVRELVTEQLRYCGLTEATKIRQLGFSVKYSFEQFLAHYRALTPQLIPLKKMQDKKAVVKSICEKYLKNNEFCFGKTQIFLKASEEKLDNALREIFKRNAVIIQKTYRSYRDRMRYQKLRTSVILVQRHWRASKLRRNFLRFRKGLLILQARIKTRQMRKDYIKTKYFIVNLQAACRGYLLRKKLMTKRNKHYHNGLQTSLVLQNSDKTEDICIDDYITEIFEDAVEEKLKPASVAVSFKQTGSSPKVKRLLETPNPPSFQKYASINFTGKSSCTFSKQILKQPLLALQAPCDRIAASAIWITILRFMGDLEEKQLKSDTSTLKSRYSIMNKVQIMLMSAQKLINNLKPIQENEDSFAFKKNLMESSKLRKLSLTQNNNLTLESKHEQIEIVELRKCYDEWLWGPKTSPLEKTQFVVGHGLLRPELRDEICCQLCRQLNQNPNQNSAHNGWLLLNLCISCFAPSEKLTPTLFDFITKSGNKFNSIQRLQRTLENGNRNQPTTNFEFNSLKNRNKMIVDIRFMDDSVLKVEVDSATTSAELCNEIRKEKKIMDLFGFSVFICMFRQILSLEDDSFFLMDGVSLFELRAREMGLRDNETPWGLVFKREFFSPWTSTLTDPLCIHLTYTQILKGIIPKEYIFYQERELGLFIAQHYYISYGRRILPDILSNVIKEIIPEPSEKQKSINWLKWITDIFKKSYFIKRKVSEEEVKMDVLKLAMQRWPLYFSKYYEAVQLAGFSMENSILLLGINSEGVYMVTKSFEVLLKIFYIEISTIEYLERDANEEDEVHIVTLKDHKYVFRSQHSRRIASIVNEILRELKLRSKYAILLKDFNPPGEKLVDLRGGDWIVLIQSRNALNGDWVQGYVPGSVNIVQVPLQIVYILPTINRPSTAFLNMFKEWMVKPTTQRRKHKSVLIKRYNLEKYAVKYLRSEHNVLSKRLEGNGIFLKYSRKPLIFPLHRNLNNLTETVIQIFDAIQCYMGDCTTAQHEPPYTRAIFEPPLHQEELRDELYCQIMKQLTENENKNSEEKGWELMSLAACLFPPSTFLFTDMVEWLETRPCRRSEECLRRLDIFRSKPPRVHVHHWLELIADQTFSPLLHPVSFPNNMHHIFEIESLTTVGELTETIGSWLGLQSIEGFSLIVTSDTSDASSLPSSDYVLDAILNACGFPNSAPDKVTPKYSYELIFVKKLWMNTHAGLDRTADLVCHYYQELSKYLAGSHNCTAESAMFLGALIFIAELEESNGLHNPQVDILKSLNRLLPLTIRDELDDHTWHSGIVAAYNENRGYSSDEAKIKFLKVVQLWPNFGSAFFTVYTSSSHQDRPQTLVVNRLGVSFVDPDSQVVLFSSKFLEILNCSATEVSFSLSIANRNLTWYSSTSQKISDLINSYIQVFDDKYFNSS